MKQASYVDTRLRNAGLFAYGVREPSSARTHDHSSCHRPHACLLSRLVDCHLPRHEHMCKNPYNRQHNTIRRGTGMSETVQSDKLAGPYIEMLHSTSVVLGFQQLPIRWNESGKNDFQPQVQIVALHRCLMALTPHQRHFGPPRVTSPFDSPTVQ